MPSLHVIYDPKDKIVTPPDVEVRFGFKSAKMAIPENLADVDIYNIAKKLAELLLEQLRR